jgi:hypothetical protein
MTNYREATSNFINGAQGVVGAVEMLKAAIASGDQDDINFATVLVASAADGYVGNTTTYQRRGFDEIAASPNQPVLRQERIASDLLAGVLVDLEIANTLMAAGRAAELDAQPDALDELETNSLRLNKLVGDVALPLGRNVETSLQTARFGFDEVPTPKPLAISANQAAAKQNYEKQVAEVFTALVGESKKVVVTTFEGFKGFDFEKLLATLGSLGKIASEIPRVSRLITKGLEIVVKALDKISELVGAGNKLETLRAVARKVQAYMLDPTKPLEELLALSYGEAQSRELIHDLAEKTSKIESDIDQGSKELVQLRTRFTEQMTLLVRIVDGVTTAKRLVNFFSPEATTILIFGSFYVLAMSYAVLAGMDFADSAGSLNFVNGVIRISEGVLI